LTKKSKEVYDSEMKRSAIQFNREKHVYQVDGHVLPGITGRIGKRLGKAFPPCLAELPVVAEAAEFGTSIHEDVEMYLKDGRLPGHSASRFVCEYIDKNFPKWNYVRAAELLVSDYSFVCTAIDIVAIDTDGNATIFDIKTGNFNREYCSWQLGIGKYLLEMDGDIKVVDHYVINTKDKFVYKIIPKSRERCISLLYGSP
jgi:hypothetical protein